MTQMQRACLTDVPPRLITPWKDRRKPPSWISWASPSKSSHVLFEFMSFAVLLASLVEQKGVGCKLQPEGPGEENPLPQFWDRRRKDVGPPTGASGVGGALRVCCIRKAGPGHRTPAIPTPSRSC